MQQCVPGSAHTQEPGNEAKIPYDSFPDQVDQEDLCRTSESTLREGSLQPKLKSMDLFRGS